ncbi:carbonic anhydrase, partial [Ralstonia pseudosolanacearum]
REAEPAPRVHGWIFGLADGRIRVLGSGEPGEAPPVRGDILEPAEAEA